MPRNPIDALVRGVTDATLMTTLADNAAFDIVLNVALIAAAALVLALVWLWLRKRFQDESQDASLGMGFTLDELARLHQCGDLTDEQYQRARARIAQTGTQIASGQNAPTLPRPTHPAANENDQTPDSSHKPGSDNDKQDESA